MAQRLLHIPELLSEICNYFSVSMLLDKPPHEPITCAAADVHEASLCLAALAATAQSHRSLFYPVVRVLWQVLDDMRPLINLYLPLGDARCSSRWGSQHTGSSEEEPRMVCLVHRSTEPC